MFQEVGKIIKEDIEKLNDQAFKQKQLLRKMKGVEEASDLSISSFH